SVFTSLEALWTMSRPVVLEKPEDVPVVGNPQKDSSTKGTWVSRKWLTVLAIAVGIIAILVIGSKVLPERSVPPHVIVEVEVELDASVQGAHLLVDGKDIGVGPQRMKFAEGEHRVDAELAGYESKGPSVFRITRDGSSPSPVTVLLDPLTPVLHIATAFQQ